ncbi:COP9 signalosome subunit 6 [Aspergillus sclerotialis]|uniref:COP9 signalosome complex subunit 6 n=1 Tax=Aspergillus sclerotialis TaxID=2070753 RepID=A0A3A2ZHA1_9EURO|nr:COP9 signalosome subunit 6 [Aspergillus sclerotialis]
MDSSSSAALDSQVNSLTTSLKLLEMADPSESLVSQKTSDSGLHIQLHPLVLLIISDHLTRHTARQQEGPIVGALLGQQNGRDITLEHAFECVVTQNADGEVQLPADWFNERVKQYKDVHKDPPLDIVGWWSTAPPSGPNSVHLPIQRQILQDYNESAVFLAFHPSLVGPSSGGKLPLTIYESVYEGDNATDGGKKMEVDGEEQSLSIKFRALPYSIETGEAEMISMDTITRTGKNAAVRPPKSGKDSKKNGKTKGKDQEEPLLSAEDEELIASLTARLNAIRTLQSRISLIKNYLISLTAEDNKPGQLDYPILRQINSLLSQLALLTPHDHSRIFAETQRQHEDVLIVSMLGQLSQHIRTMRDIGKKASALQNARHSAMTRRAFQSRFEEEYLQDSPGSSDMFT